MKKNIGQIEMLIGTTFISGIILLNLIYRKWYFEMFLYLSGVFIGIITAIFLITLLGSDKK